MEPETALQATMVLSVLLFFKNFISNLGLGGAKLTAGTRPAEDFYQQTPDPKDEEKAEARLKRSQGIVNNDLENIPVGLVITWASLFAIWFGTDNDVRERQALAHVILFSLFVLARALHTVFYTLALSFPRTTVWTLGLLSVIGIGINGCVATFFVKTQDYS